jgi:hypothetical protein
MTNWCKNLVTISNDDRKVIKEIENAFERDKLLDAFIPCPKELEELTSLKPNDALVTKMVAKYGAEIGTCGGWTIGVPNGTPVEATAP